MQNVFGSFVTDRAVGRDRSKLRRSVLALAIASAGMATQVMAQSTTGTISGQAPVAAGESVQITGGAGFNRTVAVDAAGRYSVTLPVGTYTVTLLQNGKPVQSRSGVSPAAAGAAEVNFAAKSALDTISLANVTVTANQLPAIDVTSSNETMTITAKQLSELPIARTAESIALLAPGAVPGATSLGKGPLNASLASFSGSTIVENAYYVNGFNTTDPLANQGGITLPYGSIEQQQTIANGYGAEYGRSAGGVISQIGKSGTNQWHFGGQVIWQPEWARASQDNIYYANPLSQTPGQEDGDLYRWNRNNTQWTKIYDLYVGGPLIKDKLFFFVSAEADNYDTSTVSTASSNATQLRNQYHDPKYYAKLDWNINDSNILSLTGMSNQHDSQGTYYAFNYDTHQPGAFVSPATTTKTTFKAGIVNFTSYITDDLTLHALFGKMTGQYYTVLPAYAGYDPNLAHILSPENENPALTGGANGGISSLNPITSINDPAHKTSDKNLRLDLEWKHGDHDVKIGIDNLTTRDMHDGSVMSGPGYAWLYGTSNPTTPIAGTNPSNSPYVAPTGTYPNGAGGYYVAQYIFESQSSVSVVEHAQFIQDNWQVAPNVLLNLGLRNDQFTNYAPGAQPYIRLTSPQWAPRLGVTWDVFGDASLKVFANAGRYYLTIPAGIAVREAASSLYTEQNYTYSGITSQGVPTGLTPIYSCGQTCGPGVPVSTNNEYGQPLNAATIAATHIKPEFQDEYVLGVQQQINPSWDWGATATLNKMGRIIDDVGDTTGGTVCTQLQLQNPSAGIACPDFNINGSILINPGSSNTFRVPNGAGGYYYATVSPSQFGFPRAFRNYYALELFLEHPFDGKWYGKLDFVESRSYGTTEGPTQSATGQGGTSQSITEQWDYGQLMEYANGDQANEHRHVLKAYGSYQIAPEWKVGGTWIVTSGAPAPCFGMYGPTQNNPGLGYGFYHWCGGQPAPPGSTGYTPWLHQLNLQAEYRPLWADRKLGIQLQVFNVFNEQNATMLGNGYGSTLSPASIGTQYKIAQYLELPRYLQLSVTYDW